MSKETELDELRLEAEAVIAKLFTKTLEVQCMMKDGKFIVAFEKLGGVMKVLNQLGVRLKEFKPSEPK